MSYRPDIISDYGIIKQKIVLGAVRRGLQLPCLNITASFLTEELVQSLGPSLYFMGLGWNIISLIGELTLHLCQGQGQGQQCRMPLSMGHLPLHGAPPSPCTRRKWAPKGVGWAERIEQRMERRR